MAELSIITPVYNVAEYLDECINSIIDQTYGDWELFLIDDGSTDSSPEICEKYAKQDNRITYIHKTNGGQSSARNLALDKVNGKYIMFVDSDDVLIGINTLSIVVEYISANPHVDIVQFPYVRFMNLALVDSQEGNSSITTIKELKSIKDYIEHTDIVNTVESSSIILKTSPWGKIYRRDLFFNVRFPEGMVYEDTFMFCDLFKVVNKISLIDCGLYGNRERMDSTTGSSPTMGKMQDKIKAFIRVMKCLMENSDNTKLKHKFYMWLLKLIASFKASFGDSFMKQIDLDDIYKYSYCLKIGSIVDTLAFIMGPVRYINLRSKYYKLKSKISTIK